MASSSSKNRLALLICIFLALAGQISLAENLQNVQVRIGGSLLAGPVHSLASANEVFVPLKALDMVGLQGKPGQRDETLQIFRQGKPLHAELALLQLNGHRMLALSDLARLVNGQVERSPVKKSGVPVVYLLAHVTSVSVQQGFLHITTSFPVPSSRWMLKDSASSKGIVDCYGAVAAEGVQPQPVPPGTPDVIGVRIGQFSLSTARVVLLLAPGASIRTTDSPAPTLPLITVSIHSVHSGPTRIVVNVPAVQSANALHGPSAKASQGAAASVNTQQSASLSGGRGTSQTVTPPVQTNGAGKTVLSGSGQTTAASGTAAAGSAASSATQQATTVQPAGQTGAANNGQPGAEAQLPSRGDLVRTPLVTAVQYTPLDAIEAHLVIQTGARVMPLVHYLPDGSLQILLPGVGLQLAQPSDVQITPNTSLVQSIETIVQPLHPNAAVSPPETSITVKSSRYLGFTIENDPDHLDFDLRIPRNAEGVLAGKTIVVDPGHGGVATGAVYGGYDEKNIVLQIALKLRRDLEAAGVRVVMTRDRDVNVPLADRPALANQIHADFFVSIHNDDCSVPNAASGTTTYYHMQDPSSRALATSVERSILAVSGLPARGARSDTMLYQHGLEVLRESTMPAILIEVAYLNNTVDRRKLIDPDFQARIAKAIVRGLRTYVEGTSQTASLVPTLPGILR